MSRERSTRDGRRRAVTIPVLVVATLLFGVVELFAQATTSPKVHGSWNQRKQTPVSDDRWPRRLRVYPNDFPAGRGHDLAARACVICHSATLITQQHKDAAAWAKTIHTMIGWGAPMDTVEGDSLRDWLVQEYGPKR